MLKNISIVLASRLLASGLFFIVNLIVINKVEIKEYAVFGLIVSTVPFVSFLGNLGTNKGGLVLIKRNELTFSEFVSFKFILSILFFISLSFYSYVFDDDKVHYIVLAGFCLCMVEFSLTVLQVSERFYRYALVNIARNILWCGASALLFFHETTSLYKYLDAFIMGSILSAAIGIIFTLQAFKFEHFQAKVVVNKMLNITKVFIVTDLSIQVMMRLEIWVLSVYIAYGFVNQEQLSIFNTAFMLSMVLPMISNSIYNVLLPKLLTGGSDRKETYNLISDRKYLIVSITLVVLIIGCLIIKLLLPNEYHEAIIPFLIIAVAVVLSFFTNILQIKMLGEHKETLVRKITLYQLLFSGLVSFLLIPIWGAIGAALSVAFIRFYGLYQTVVKNKL